MLSIIQLEIKNVKNKQELKKFFKFKLKALKIERIKFLSSDKASLFC